MKLTVDANIWVGALDGSDPLSAFCRRCLQKAAEASAVLHSPLLLPVEVAASVSRKTRETRHGRLAAQWVRRFNGHVWHPLSEELAEEAERLAAAYFLRGADAVYAAVAGLTGSTLLTYDDELIRRPPKRIKVLRPDVWLGMVR